MSACTFFGHHDCPETVRPILRKELVKLIEEQEIDTFYVGNHGNFDMMVRSVLRELSSIYHHITYHVVLAYMPTDRDIQIGRDFSDSVLPEGIENAPRRFAIDWRNRWMLQRCDWVVAYIVHSGSRAARYTAMATRQKKAVINLADYNKA